MKPHVRNYFKALGYDESSVIMCECGCNKVATDLHHVVPKSLGGSDDATNIIALARNCHENAHGVMAAAHKIKFKDIISRR